MFRYFDRAIFDIVFVVSFKDALYVKKLENSLFWVVNIKETIYVARLVAATAQNLVFFNVVFSIFQVEFGGTTCWLRGS